MLRIGLIILIGATLAVFSGIVTAGAITKSRAPDVALSVWPTNGFAAESAARNRISAAVVENGGQFPEVIGAETVALAEKAFQSEPISPDAVAVLAMSQSGAKRHELMQKAFQLSRRRQLVTGWLIHDSGVREDIPALLGYYDNLLRTKEASGTVVIPVMANALSNDAFIEPFSEILRTDPPWARWFWREIVTKRVAVVNAAQVRKNLHGSGVSETVFRDQGLLRALIRERQFAEAEKLYHLFTGGSQKPILMNGRSFDEQPEYPPFDWQIFSTGEYGGSINDGQLQMSAIRNSGGQFARQLVRLPEAQLTITVAWTGEIPSNASLNLNLGCAELLEERPLDLRIPFSGSGIDQTISNEGTGCRYFWLQIDGRANTSREGFDFQIDKVSIDAP
ncbi:MAG: hypothetical protein AAGE37_06790 [Pseudomonadota bacterium]